MLSEEEFIKEFDRIIAEKGLLVEKIYVNGKHVGYKGIRICKRIPGLIMYHAQRTVPKEQEN